jgi:hypothetical protein
MDGRGAAGREVSTTGMVRATAGLAIQMPLLSYSAITPHSRSEGGVMRRFGLAGAAVLLALLSFALAPTGATAVVPRTSRVVFHSPGDGEPLPPDSTVVEMQGELLPNGNCSFPVPVLELAPGQTSVEAVQVSADYSVCSESVAIGSPQGDAVPSQGRRRATAVTSKGYFRIEWDDVAEIDVNDVKSNITWKHDGSCVVSASGTPNYSWNKVTGWTQVSKSSALTPTQCPSRAFWASSHYQNSVFCWPATVHVYYDRVTVYGYYDGYLGSSLGGTSDNSRTIYGCLPLHWHAQLIRTQN